MGEDDTLPAGVVEDLDNLNVAKLSVSTVAYNVI